VAEEAKVGKWQRLVPDGTLNRTRLAAAGIGGLATISQLFQLGNTLHSTTYLRWCALDILLIFVLLVVTHLRGRASWWSVPLVPALTAVGASGLKDPLAGVAIALGATLVLSLYGPTWLWALRVVGAVVAMPVALVISPWSIDRPMDWNSPSVLGVLPQVVLMSVMMRTIYVALVRQERTSKQEELLARAGRAMLGVTDYEQIREVGRQTVLALAELNPGVVLLVLRRDQAGLWVSSIAGAAPELRGRRLPDDVITDPAVITDLVPGFSAWRFDALGEDLTTADAIMAVGGPDRVPTDVWDAFLTLSHQVVLGEKGCRAHAELERRAHHDHLTSLPTRAKFAQALEDALAAGAVALINVDLDDFKQVNDSYGHAAGDELLVEVAARMSAMAAGRGLAARFGGDEFALLLTGLGTEEAGREQAELLSRRLTAPVRLTAATVTPGASIGVAIAAPGVTATELTRQADMAMYAAKTGGKNRIETFRPVHDRQVA
jgi:diguanylate cyclase (GGDEF)-like protein